MNSNKLRDILQGELKHTTTKYSNHNHVYNSEKNVAYLLKSIRTLTNEKEFVNTYDLFYKAIV